MKPPRALRIIDGKAASRRCGSCTECCTAGAVDELSKPAGVRCPNLRRDKPGCAVHGSAPETCGSFRCLWLQGVGPDDARPDRVGVFLTLQAVPHLPASSAPGAFARQNLTGGRGLIAVECWRDAARTSARSILDEIRKVAPIAVVEFPAPFPKTSKG